MKKLLIIVIFISCYSNAQTTTDYNLNVTNGVFTVNFVNTPWTIGTSIDISGQFKTSCRQVYLDLVVKLLTYGNTPAHWRGTTDSIEGLQIITQSSHPFILMVDSKGRVWKISKPNALLLAAQLNVATLFNQLPSCVCPCN